ncbi:MAG: beta-glucosidase [Acidimicrobiaceae bacterium]|nr:beta-glucosidase [Acidimicrobiaceae bacterium]
MTTSLDVASLVRQLTLEEKASLCLGADFWHTRAIDRLGIPAIMMSDGPHGLRKQPEEGDHIALSGSVAATCFPTASALGSSWDTALLQEVGEALGREARAMNVSVVLGPGLNIKRTPVCGRNFEYFSEDPVLSGDLAAAIVQGIQSQGVGACVKHYAANNQETDRLRVSADVDERPLREIYLTGFERAVIQAQPWTVMCAYNKVNGTYASEHRHLLTEVLRHDWGFAGLVVSDWGAVHDRVAALAAGLDLEMPPNLGVSDAQIVAAVNAGDLDESLLDAAVARVLTLVDQAMPNLGTGTGTGSGTGSMASFDVDAHHALARAVARDCAVLLKNDDEILPLQPRAGARIAVIGEFARTPRYQGAGSSQVNPTRVDNALDEIRALAPVGVEVSFAPGFGVETDQADGDAARRSDAVALATGANTVVVFLGLPASAESEGFDRKHMDLPPSQITLLAELAEANPQIVVVLANGSAVRLAGWEHHAKALLECWLSGQAGGGATADLLFGRANPSGRLAESLPLRLEDTPSYLNFPGDSGQVRYGEGIFVGYRAYDALKQAVSYPFGHGLSYTTFEYGDVSVRVSGSHDEGDLEITVSCVVLNTGDRAGKEVVQLYVRDVEASVSRPVRELKRFTKVRLGAGQGTIVTFGLTSRDLSYWSVTRHDWVLEAGQYEIAVGASSRNLGSTATIDIAARPVREPLGPMSTLDEWLADPAGSVALRAAIGTVAPGAVAPGTVAPGTVAPGTDAVGTADAGRPGGILGDDELLKVIGSFPVSTLAAFPGSGVDHEMLAALLDQLRH